MKMPKSLAKSIALLLILVLISTMTACGGTTANPATATATSVPASTASSDTKTAEPSPSVQASKEPVTVTLLYNEAGHDTWNKYDASPVQQEIKRITGVTLKLMPADDNKFNVMVASGDLPELIHVNNKDKMTQMITGGNVIPMDDLIGTNGQDIQKALSTALDFSRKFWSNDTGKLYYLPVEVGYDEIGQEATIGPAIRWDYYKELGYPAITSEDDLLKVLADMVKLHPKTDEGKTVFGVGFWSDWGTWPYMLATSPMLGYSGFGATGAIKNETNEYVDMVTDLNTPYWKSVSFFYKANKLGIFDKDSFTMKNGDWNSKCTSGQEMLAPANWAAGDFNKENVAKGKGYMVVPMDFGSQWNGANYIPGWGGKQIGITKSAKDPKRVMDLLNYMWSEEGARTMFSGVKGVHWDIVDGKAKLKDDVLQLKIAGGDAWANTGIQTDMNLVGLSPFNLHSVDGARLNLFETSDAYVTTLNPLQKDFSDHYAVKYPGEIFALKMKEGKNKNQSNYNTVAAAIVPPTPDDIKRIETRLNDTALQEFAKCIMSKSDAEFTANQQNAIKSFKDAGSDKYAEWYRTAWNNAVAASK